MAWVLFFLMVWFCSVYVSENASQCQGGEQEGFVAAGRAPFLRLLGLRTWALRWGL